LSSHIPDSPKRSRSGREEGLLWHEGTKPRWGCQENRTMAQNEWGRRLEQGEGAVPGPRSFFRALGSGAGWCG
jgi:hypothetical protein